MIKCIYVGRLCIEKGCDLILDFFNTLNSTYIDKVSLDVYGDGVLKDEFVALGQKMDTVTYHGYTKKDTILENWKTMHYTLMPSRFLETFGLSALDSFGVGVPVIGFQKGGLEQFGECVIDIGEEENFTQILSSTLNTYDEIYSDTMSKGCIQEFDKHSKELWLERCRQIFGVHDFDGKKILLASDYIVKLGGIETYILDVKQLLEEQGAEVKLMGCDVIRHGWKRYGAMLLSFFNISFGCKLNKEVNEQQPDIIRWHSVQRRIGWLPLWMMRNFSGKQFVMYHDFGLLHPFPSQVYAEDQLGYDQTLVGFVKASKKTGVGFICWFPLLLLKWLSNLFLWHRLKKIDTHLVPSGYMSKRIVNKDIDKEKIVTLPHFV